MSLGIFWALVLALVRVGGMVAFAILLVRRAAVWIRLPLYWRWEGYLLAPLVVISYGAEVGMRASSGG